MQQIPKETIYGTDLSKHFPILFPLLSTCASKFSTFPTMFSTDSGFVSLFCPDFGEMHKETARKLEIILFGRSTKRAKICYNEIIIFRCGKTGVLHRRKKEFHEKINAKSHQFGACAEHDGIRCSYKCAGTCSGGGSCGHCCAGRGFERAFGRWRTGHCRRSSEPEPGSQAGGHGLLRQWLEL